MSNPDQDIDVMLDALGFNTARYAVAQRVLHTMQDYNPELYRGEGIIGMIVAVLGAVPQESHDKLTQPLQDLSNAWNDFCSNANGGGAPYPLSPELTRILKTISFMELEACFAKPEATDRMDMVAQSWDIAHILEKTQKRAAYFGPSHCMALDIAHDDTVLQLEIRKDALLMRVNAATGHQPKPPQP